MSSYYLIEFVTGLWLPLSFVGFLWTE